MNTTDLCENSPYVQFGNNETANRIPGNIIFTDVYFAIGVFVDITCLVLFIAFKRRYERTQLRPTLLLAMSVCGSLSQMCYGSLITITKGAYPCWTGVFLLILCIPLIGGSIIGRLVLFLYLSRFSEAATRQMAQTGALDERADIPHSGTWTMYKVAFNSLFCGRKRDQTPAETQRELYDMRFLVSRRGIFMTTWVFILPFIILSIALMVSDPVYIYCINCAITPPMVFACVFVGIIVLAVGGVSWWRIRRLRDAWGMASECFWCLIWCAIGFTGFLLTVFQDREKYYVYSHQIILSWGLCLIVVQQSVVQLAIAWYQQRKSRSRVGESDPSSPTTNRPNSVNGTLDDILKDPTSTQEFEKHLADEFGLESLLFLRDAETWRRTFYDISESARRARAKQIEKTYVNYNGLYSINIPADCSSRIHSLLKDATVPLEVSLFDDAIAEVRKLLNIGAVRRYLMRSVPSDKSHHVSSSTSKSQVAREVKPNPNGSDLQLSASVTSEAVA